MIGLLAIREATAADLDAVAGLALSPSTVRTLPAVLETDGHPCLVAQLDCELVGVAVGVVLHDEGHVVDVAVAERSRGQGVGVRLLAELEDRLRRAGATATTLEVRPSNRAARALYGRLGYVQEGRRRGYYPDGEDALILWRRPVGGEVARTLGARTAVSAAQNPSDHGRSPARATAAEPPSPVRAAAAEPSSPVRATAAEPSSPARATAAEPPTPPRAAAAEPSSPARATAAEPPTPPRATAAEPPSSTPDTPRASLDLPARAHEAR